MLLETLGIEKNHMMALADAQRDLGEVVMLVAIDEKLAGFIGVADPIKQTTPQACGIFDKATFALSC